MLVFRGSMNFTSHLEVLIAPRAPIDPEDTRIYEDAQGRIRGTPRRNLVRSCHTEA
jgi:hypothetical protein